MSEQVEQSKNFDEEKSQSDGQTTTHYITSLISASEKKTSISTAELSTLSCERNVKAKTTSETKTKSFERLNVERIKTFQQFWNQKFEKQLMEAQKTVGGMTEYEKAIQQQQCYSALGLSVGVSHRDNPCGVSVGVIVGAG